MSNATADSSAGSQSFDLGPLVIAEVAYVSTVDEPSIELTVDKPSIELRVPFRPEATYGVPEGMTLSFTEGLPDDIKSSIYWELTKSQSDTLRFTQLMRDYVDAENPSRRAEGSSAVLREPILQEQSRLNLNVSEFVPTGSKSFIDEYGQASGPPVPGVYELSEHHVKLGAPSSLNPGSDITISLSFKRAGELPLAARTRSQNV